MIKLILFIQFGVCGHILLAQQKVLQKIYGEASPPSMISMDSSHYLISGYWQTTAAPFGYLAELDSVGNINWCKQYTDSAGNDTRIAGTYKLNNGTYLVSCQSKIVG